MNTTTTKTNQRIVLDREGNEAILTVTKIHKQPNRLIAGTVTLNGKEEKVLKIHGYQYWTLESAI